MTKRILLIDDEDHIREVTQTSLEALGGWEVTAASSGAEGIEAALAMHPDAVLLDVMMPEMDGPTTFRNLRADPRTNDIPVLLLTAKVQSADRQWFADLGVNGVLTKPFDPLTLAEEVADSLGWPPP